MARLSKHGVEVWRLVGIEKALAIMSDGTALKNSGNGWKMAGKIKAGKTPEQAASDAENAVRGFLRARPSYARFKACIFRLAPGLGKRVALMSALRSFPDDPDGLWLETQESYSRYRFPKLDLQDCVDLCTAYGASRLERQRAKQAAIAPDLTT